MCPDQYASVIGYRVGVPNVLEPSKQCLHHALLSRGRKIPGAPNGTELSGVASPQPSKGKASSEVGGFGAPRDRGIVLQTCPGSTIPCSPTAAASGARHRRDLEAKLLELAVRPRCNTQGLMLEVEHATGVLI